MKEKMNEIVALIFKIIPLAMGVGVTVLSVMKEIDVNSAVTMLGLGLACAGVSLLQKRSEK